MKAGNREAGPAFGKEGNTMTQLVEFSEKDRADAARVAGSFVWQGERGIRFSVRGTADGMRSTSVVAPDPDAALCAAVAMWTGIEPSSWVAVEWDRDPATVPVVPATEKRHAKAGEVAARIRRFLPEWHDE